MTVFVLDNSVAMRWHLTSEISDDQRYAEDVLASLAGTGARVPNLWHLEAANVLLGAEKRGDTSIGEVEAFMAQLENLPIEADQSTANKSFTRIMALARAYKLSSYDAAYLELALREGLPLATLDTDLVRAAKQADVALYLRR